VRDEECRELRRLPLARSLVVGPLVGAVEQAVHGVPGRLVSGAEQRCGAAQPLGAARLLARCGEQEDRDDERARVIAAALAERLGPAEGGARLVDAAGEHEERGGES
jgi:hypothetical protein